MARDRNTTRGKPAATVSGHYWTHGETFFPLNDAILSSTAWTTLSYAAQAVLVDWLCQYWRLSRSDTVKLDEGFQYSPAHCRVPCAERTFYEAVKAIQERGFFEAPERLQSDRADDGVMWTPSYTWRTWEAPRETAARLKGKEKAKRRRIEKHRKRSAEYYAKTGRGSRK